MSHVVTGWRRGSATRSSSARSRSRRSFESRATNRRSESARCTTNTLRSRRRWRSNRPLVANLAAVRRRSRFSSVLNDVSATAFRDGDPRPLNDLVDRSMFLTRSLWCEVVIDHIQSFEKVNVCYSDGQTPPHSRKDQSNCIINWRI